MRRLILALLLWLAFGWLMLNMPDDSLWYDETVNAYLATSAWDTIVEWTTDIDNQLPLHFVLLKLWTEVAGSSEFVLRLFSVFAVWLAAAGIIALEQRLFPAPVRLPWFAATAFLLLGGTLYAAYEVRTYALSLALLAWTFIYALTIVAKPHANGRLVVFAILAALLSATHYTAWLALPVFAFLLVFTPPHTLQGTLRTAVVPLLLAALVVVGWLLALGGRDINAGTAFVGSVSVRAALETYTTFALFGQKLFTSTAHTQAFIFFTVVMLFALLCTWRHRTLTTVSIILLALLPVAAMTFAVNQIEGKLSGRHTWALWLSTPLVMRGGVEALRYVLPAQARLLAQRMSIAMTLLVLFALAGALRTNLPAEYRGDLRGAIATINAQAGPDDLLVLRDGTLFTAAEYYNVEIDYIGIPDDKLTNVNHQIQFFEAMDNFLAADFLERPRIWVLSWQADTMDPTALGLVIPEYYSDGQRQVWLEGGERGVSLYSYDIQRRQNTLQEHIVAFEGVVQVPSDGPSLLGIDSYHNRVNSTTCASIVHTWWWRGETDYPTTLVSAQLVPEATGFPVMQQDRPPAGFFFPQDRWEPFVPVVGRFELRYPCVLVTRGEGHRIDLVVYDSAGEKQPQSILTGPVQFE